MAKDKRNASEIIQEDLLKKTYGITGTLDELLDTRDDIHLELGASANYRGENRGSISDLVIRNGNKRKEYLSDTIEDSMNAMGQRYVHAIPFNDRTRLIREFNYMLTQMPQLYTTLHGLTNFIMSPDNYMEEPLNQDIFISSNNNNSVTDKDIAQFLEDKGLYGHIREGILGSMCLGYRYFEVLPLADIASKLLKRMENMRHKDNTNNETQKPEVNGTRIPNTKLYADSSKFKPATDLTFYSESNKFTFPKAMVELYREVCTTDKYTSQVNLYDAVDEVLNLGVYGETYKLYGESYSGKKIQEIPMKDRATYLGSMHFSESPYSIADRDLYARKMHDILIGNEHSIIPDEGIINTYSESDKDESYKKALLALKKSVKSKSKTKVKDLTGCHVKPLDDEKTFPIIIDKELFGVYVLDSYQDTMMSKSMVANINNVLGSTKFADQSDYKDNPIVRKDIIDGLSSVLKQHMDSNFVTDNRRILTSIQAVLDEHDMYQTQFRIRYIPRKYLVPFNSDDSYNGLGKSKLQNAKVPITNWIYLNQDKMMTKLFYEKDKLGIKYKTTWAQSIHNDRTDAMELFTNMYPLPSELLDFTRVYSCMGTIGRLLIPVDKSGQSLFDIERFEGQKHDTEKDEYMKELESDIENILGFPMQTLNGENKYDYATSIIAQDGRLTNIILAQQKHYAPMATELATKIARFESGVEDVFVNITFQEPKLLTKSISNENLSKFTENIDNQINLYYGEDSTNLPPEKRNFVRRELVKELYPAYDNSTLMEKIESSWNLNKDKLINKPTE